MLNFTNINYKLSANQQDRINAIADSQVKAIAETIVINSINDRVSNAIDAYLTQLEAGNANTVKSAKNNKTQAIQTSQAIPQIEAMPLTINSNGKLQANNNSNVYNDLIKYCQQLPKVSKQSTGRNLTYILTDYFGKLEAFTSRRQIKDRAKNESYDDIRYIITSSGKLLIEVFNKNNQFHIVANNEYKGINNRVVDFFPSSVSAN